MLRFDQIREVIVEDHGFTQTLSYFSWINLLWSI